MQHSLHTLPPGNSFATLPQTCYSRLQWAPFEAAAGLPGPVPAVAADPLFPAIFSGSQRHPGCVPPAML